MNTAVPNTPQTPNPPSAPKTHSLAATVLLSLAVLMACQSPPPSVMAAAADNGAPAGAMPAPQAPFDITPISPVESAGAAAE